MTTTRSHKVMRIITRPNIGGPAIQALLLSRSLAPAFDTVLVSGTPPPHEGELSDPEVDVHRIPLVRPIRPVSDMRAYRAISRLIGTQRPDIVHTHMAKAGALGRLAAGRAGSRPRIVHTYHGHVLDGYFSSPLQRTFVAVERRLAKKSDVLIAVSTEIRDQLLDLGIGRSSQFAVVPLGFDLSPFLRINETLRGWREELGVPSTATLIGTVGRLTRIKNHALLLAAIVPLSDVHLAVIGDGELRPSLEEQARQLGIARRVHFLGWRLDIADVLRGLDVVVLASRNEGTPVALIEALATGRPVVATRVGGVESVVRNGETGLLVEPGNREALTAAIHTLVKNDALRRKMGIVGREDVAVRYGKERLLEDIRAIYYSLLETKV